MRPEKQYLVEEVNNTSTSPITYTSLITSVSPWKKSLSCVPLLQSTVLSSTLSKTASSVSLPLPRISLTSVSTSTGQTAIIVGGDNPSGVAKALGEFFKKKEKVDIKAGILNEKALTKEEIAVLAKLPGLEALRAQLLGLFTQPATGFVRILNAVPQSLLFALQAKAEKDGE